MKPCKASILKIESFGLVDGPGIRTVVFFNGCNLRCKFCHNPETWVKKEDNITSDELVKKILKNKPYYQNNGGVTFSGGEPLLHYDFLLETCKKLKEENIHIALDTAGIGLGHYKRLLNLVDLVILDIKSITKEGYQKITQTNQYDEFKTFINELNKSNKEVWIRQVIIPEENDTEEYVKDLAVYLKNNIKNITKVEFLPFHTMGFQKYEDLKIINPYKNKEAMDKKKCDELYNIFEKEYKKEQ